MPTIPTGKMELELRRLYVRWLSRLGDNTDMNAAVDRFEKQSIDLIEKMGGQTARLGALADFPAPKRLDLSPHIGTIYSDMKQAAIQAGIQAGLNASDVARHMFRAGMDKSYHRLNRLARTETVSAYWKNAWGSIEDLPELVMIWGAESGPRTCQWCLERDGMVMESSQLRDHPNGRCTPIPTLRSMVEYKGSVDSSGRIFQDPEWTKKPAEIKRLTKPSDWSDSDLAPVYQAATTPGVNGYEPLRPVLDKQGFGTPQVVPDEVFDALEAAPLYRGLALRDIPLQDMLNNFHARQDYYIGSGIYGNGWYFTDSRDIASGYAGWNGVVSETKLLPGARMFNAGVVDSAEDILDLPEFAWTKDAKYAGTPVSTDPSVAAVMMGYDGLIVKEYWNGKTNTFTVILNRGALAMKEGPK